MLLGWKLILCRLPASCQFKIFTGFNRGLRVAVSVTAQEGSRYTEPAPVFLPKFHTRLWTRLEQELKGCGQGGKDSAHWRQVLHLHWSSLWYTWCWLPFVMETLPRVQWHKRTERAAWAMGRKGMAWCRKDVKVPNIHKNRDVLKKKGVGKSKWEAKNIGTFKIAKRAFSVC